MPIADFTTEVVRPSALSASDIAAWHMMMEQSPFLQRGFFAPEFALACERAHDLARVVVFRREQVPVAFFPFQFASRWNRMIGAGERIGGDISDHAGLIASSGFCIATASLLAAARLNALFVTHLNERQTVFGLVGEDWRVGHVIDLRGGAERYLQELLHNRSDFFQDTRRRLRRAQRDFGAVEFVFDAAPAFAQVIEILDAKRHQYARTGAGDVFGNPAYIAIIKSLIDYSSIHCRPVISVLRAGDHVLARHLGLMSQGVLSYWFPVYEPAAKAVSLGRLLLWHVIEAAREHGITFIDRGEGGESSQTGFFYRHPAVRQGILASRSDGSAGAYPVFASMALEDRAPTNYRLNRCCQLVAREERLFQLNLN